MKILFFGDIFGRPGRTAVKNYLEKNKKKLGVDLVIANVDNMASGRGPTRKTYEELLNTGVDVMTSGDHIWDYKESIELLEDKDSRLIRPYNFVDDCPGKGFIVVKVKGIDVLVSTFVGRVFMMEGSESPFYLADELLNNRKEKIKIIDFHAEATSEKMAFATYLAGRVSAVLSTHTHVQTADERIISGTAYISDVGFCGPYDSVIGVDKNQSIKRFKTGMLTAYNVAEGPVQINAVLVEINNSGQAVKIERIFEIKDSI